MWKKITYDYNGVVYTTIDRLLIASNEKKNTIGSYNYSENRVISSGEEKLIVKLIDRNPRGVRVTIDYKTIYEEKYTYQFSF